MQEDSTTRDPEQLHCREFQRMLPKAKPHREIAAARFEADVAYRGVARTAAAGAAGGTSFAEW